MKSVNLVDFWSVQEFSDGRVFVFLSEQKARDAIQQWEEKLEQKRQAWIAGDRPVSDSLCTVNYEPDVDGKLQRNVQLSPGCRPGGLQYHSKFSAQQEQWSDAVGSDLIEWGNPATARPKVNTKPNKPRVKAKTNP